MQVRQPVDKEGKVSFVVENNKAPRQHWIQYAAAELNTNKDFLLLFWNIRTSTGTLGWGCAILPTGTVGEFFTRIFIYVSYTIDGFVGGGVQQSADFPFNLVWSLSLGREMTQFKIVTTTLLMFCKISFLKEHSFSLGRKCPGRKVISKKADKFIQVFVLYISSQQTRVCG